MATKKKTDAAESEPETTASEGGGNDVVAQPDRDTVIRAALGSFIAGASDLDTLEATPGLFAHGWMGDVMRAVMQLHALKQEVTTKALVDHMLSQNHRASAHAFAAFLGV